MRELPFSANPERQHLVSVCLLNELLYARAVPESHLNLMLPAVEGATIHLPTPALFADLFGDRSSPYLHLEELLKLYLDCGGYLRLAISTDAVRKDAALLHLAHDLTRHSARAKVNASPDLATFCAVGECSAFETAMCPGRFDFKEGIFRYYSEPEEVKGRRHMFDDYWQRMPRNGWQTALRRGETP